MLGLLSIDDYSIGGSVIKHLNFDIYADSGKICTNGLGYFLCLRMIIDVGHKYKIESIRISGFCQHRFSSFRIISECIGKCFVIAVIIRTPKGRGAFAIAAHNIVNYCLNVYCIVKSLTDKLILQSRTAGPIIRIVGYILNAVHLLGNNRDIACTLKHFGRLELHVHDNVNSAIYHLCYTSCSFRYCAHHNTIDFRFFSPVCGILFQNYFFVCFPTYKGVRTCTDGISSDSFLTNLLAISRRQHRNFC